MSARLFAYLTCLLVTIYNGDAEPVSFITKCKAGDAKCLKQSMQAAIPAYAQGIPELKVSSLDPLQIKKVDASGNGLNLILNDIAITGLKSCQVYKTKWDQNPTHIQMQLTCDGNVDGIYDMSGRLLILPIEGNGEVHAKLRKLFLTIDANIEEKPDSEGKSHWNIKSFSHSFELKDKCDVEFQNLFKDNADLAAAAQTFVKTSGNEIIMEVGPPVVKAVVSKLVRNINLFFRAVPLEDLVEQ